MGATCHVRTGTGGQTRGQIEGYPFYIWQSDLIVHYALLEKRRDKMEVKVEVRYISRLCFNPYSL